MNKSLFASAVLALVLGAAPAAIAHHGPGQFRGGEVTVTGVVTNIRFVNPHAYIYMDVVGEDGETEAWRFEMQAGSLLRRAGWDESMFPEGTEITITGAAGTRERTAALYSTGVFADGTELGRSTQRREVVDDVSAMEVESRLASGTLDLNGTWAAPQRYFDPTEAARRANAAAGGGMGAPTGRGGGGGGLPNGVSGLTEAGEAAVERYAAAGGGNPRHRCEAVNIFHDWTFDRHVNEIIQTEDTIVMKMGLMDIVRTIHLDMDEHPANIVPSKGGHSIGRLDGATLHVDTIGFTGDGYLSASLLHSDQFHVTETFTYNPEDHSLTRVYSAVDPVNFTGTYSGEDVVYISNTPFEDYACVELMDDFIEPIE
ncbi:MAG: hypothetical protein HOL48_09400 [Porticoccaceae bacterium]|jgi:hypothetical protein|nr:hypothetical protein [Porticoccaceae bacterium]